MKTITFILISLFTLSAIISRAQDYPLIPDHPGTFKLINWGVYTHWNCGFTKAETTANYQKIIGIVDMVRKNPVFTNQKGFECETYVFAKKCPDKSGYGIPCELSFGFEDYFMDKGKVAWYNIEPPSWKLQVNHFESISLFKTFSMDTPEPREDIKEGFSYEKWKIAGARLKGIFELPGDKEELGNGIDRYRGELTVIYNPDRPPYYLPVRFREVAEALIEFYKLHPDKYKSEMIGKAFEDEYAQIPEIERDGWAYYNINDDRCPLMGISPTPSQQPIVRLNPEYWNRNLPRSAIQVLSFYHLADKIRYTQVKDEALKRNSSGYSVARFEEALDITTLVPAIDK